MSCIMNNSVMIVVRICGSNILTPVKKGHGCSLDFWRQKFILGICPKTARPWVFCNGNV